MGGPPDHEKTFPRNFDRREGGPPARRKFEFRPKMGTLNDAWRPQSSFPIQPLFSF